MIVTFAALKGRVGKITGTAYLDASLSDHGTVRLIDADPQRSLAMWAREADEGWFPTVKTILDRAVTRANAAGVDFTMIDTPAGNPDAITAAGAAADLVFVPTRPSHLDEEHTAKSLESFTQAQIPASVLVVGAEPRRRTLRDLREFLTNLPEAAACASTSCRTAPTRLRQPAPARPEQICTPRTWSLGN